MSEEMFNVQFSEAEREALREALSDMKNPVNISVFVSDACRFCEATIYLVNVLRDESPEINGRKLINVEIYYNRRDDDIFEAYKIDRTPTITLVDGHVRYVGIPAGEEIKGLVETIIRISRDESGLRDEIIKALAEVDVPIRIETIVTPSCPYCPYAALLANMFAYENWKSGRRTIVSEVIEAYENVDIAERYGVMTVPTIAINGEVEFIGVPYDDDLLSRVMDKVKRIKEAQRIKKGKEMLKRYIKEYLRRLEEE